MKGLMVLKSLGLWGSFRLALNLVFSKLLFPSARLVRFPFYIRREGRVQIGNGFSANPGLILDTYGKHSRLIIGKNVMANYRLHIGACDCVEIGSGTLFGSDCLVIDHSHGSYGPDIHSDPAVSPQLRPLSVQAIKIGKKCWLGDRVSVMPGVTIGDGVVVGAGSIVTTDLPANVVAVGAPARIVKRYNSVTSEWLSEKDNIT